VPKIEIGLKVPSLSTTIRLAKALGMEVSDIPADDDAKWMDQAPEIAFALSSLPDAEAESLVGQFRTTLEHIRGLLEG
jgi:hypothetical protein